MLYSEYGTHNTKMNKTRAHTHKNTHTMARWHRRDSRRARAIPPLTLATFHALACARRRRAPLSALPTPDPAAGVAADHDRQPDRVPLQAPGFDLGLAGAASEAQGRVVDDLPQETDKAYERASADSAQSQSF